MKAAMNSQSNSSMPVVAEGPTTYRIGTLTYTKMGILTLFFWLLWGDFCFMLLETLVPGFITLRLASLETPNWVIGFMLSAIPSGLSLFLNPMFSMASDRHRGPYGRRIPYLAITTPLVVGSMVLLGFSSQIGTYLHLSLFTNVSESTAIALVIAIGMIIFSVFNGICSHTFYYLFNDVVPREFLGRFMALFRMVGSLAVAFYNGFVIAYANTHMAEVFVGMGVLFLIAFGLMCWKVKEGSYPPVDAADVKEPPKFMELVKLYFRDCFSHRIYWYFFVANAFYAMSWPVGAFSPLLAKSVGVDLATYGKITAISGLITAALMYPAGLLADKIHPLRMMIGTTILIGASQIMWMYYLFFDPSPENALTIYIIFSAISVPVYALYGAAEMPMYMRLLPPAKYGQFCSANAMFRSMLIAGAGVLSGGLIDVAGSFFKNKGDAYRVVPVWLLICFTGSTIFLWLLLREWKRHGGDKAYSAPICEP